MTPWYRREEDQIIGKIDNQQKKEIHKKRKPRKLKAKTQAERY